MCSASCFGKGLLNRSRAWGLPGGSAGKESACNVEDLRSLGWEDPLEEGTATHSNILARRIPWTEEPGRLQSMRSQSDTTERSDMHRQVTVRTGECFRGFPELTLPQPAEFAPFDLVPHLELLVKAVHSLSADSLLF